MMVQAGTVKVGDIVLCGSSYGRIKAIYDTLNASRQLKSAGPSVPSTSPDSMSARRRGTLLCARRHCSGPRIGRAPRATLAPQSLSGTSPKVSFETFQNLLQSGKLGKAEETVQLNLIIRAGRPGQSGSN